MAASYQTGTATSPTNLLQTLVTWLVNQGWTQNQSAADGAGWRAHLVKNGLYVNMRAAENENLWTYTAGGGYGILMYLGDGYSGAVSWGLQSGAPLQNGTSNPIGAGMNLNAGAVVAYHFFDDGNDHITVVVEKSAGVFVHMGWGPTMVKTGFTDDFPYFYGSSPSYYNHVNPAAGTPGGDITASAPMAHSVKDTFGDVYSSGFVRVDATTFSGRWMGNGTNTGTTEGYTGRYGRCALNQSGASVSEVQATEYPNYIWLKDRSIQTSFPGALLLPLHWFVETASGRWAPVGYPPTVFGSLAVGNGFSAGEIYQVGGTDYMVFPNFAVEKAA